MEVSSPEFFVFSLLLAIAYNLYNSPRYHAWVMALANGAFVSTYVYWPQQKFFLGWLLVSGYAMASLVQRGKVRSRLAIGLYVSTLVALLLVVRVAQYENASPPPVILVGYSFLMFKLIHMLVDAAQGRLEELRPLTYFNYICGFYTWVCGPIQRYQDFARQATTDAPLPSTEHVLEGLDRIVNGCLKAFVLAPWVTEAASVRPLLQYDNVVSPYFWAYLALWFYGFYLFLFLDFSGYTDIVIGTASLLGMRLPENFHYPWMARNLIDFWQRWHMTLSHWLRDYLFHPRLLEAHAHEPAQALAQRRPGLPADLHRRGHLARAEMELRHLRAHARHGGLPQPGRQ